MIYVQVELAYRFYLVLRNFFMHPTQIEIDSQQFKLNLSAIRQQIGAQVKFCLPVKANSYGHGLLGIAKLAEAYVDYFGVACLAEGALLRQQGISKAILVFGAFDEEQIAGLIKNNLELTISSCYKAELVASYCQKHNQACRIHLKVDTGMNRVGIRASSFLPLLEYVLAQPSLELVGVYSHFAASDELENDFTLQQIERFSQIVALVKAKKADVICHLANSGGVCYYPESYFDMVRPGLLSYGYFPAQIITQAPLNQIRAILSLVTRVSYFKVVAEGSGISYNHRYTTGGVSRIITLPIGYGDGYRRGLSNLGEVIVRGHKYKIAGSICMDMLMVDLGATGEAYVGDRVILIGNQGMEEILISQLALKLNSIIYEVLVGFNERIPRVII